MAYIKRRHLLLVSSKCRGFFHCYAKSIGILLTMLSFFTYAATDEQIKHIQSAAEQYILDSVTPPTGGELHVEAANIDNRLKATDCPVPLQTSSTTIRNNRSNINVLVECPPDDWKIYVPVRLSVAVPLITATRPLVRGQIIDQSDITSSFIELQRYRKDGFSSQDQLIGAKIKRNVRLGDVIERNDVCVVCRNEKVTIKAGKGGMSIITQGTALQDGAYGEQIRVKNDKSQRIIEGTVTNIGEVTVSF